MVQKRSIPIRLSLAAVPVLLLATACFGPTDGGSGSTEGNACSGVQVNVGVVTAVSDAPFFIADERGYFEEEGLRVNFQSFDSAARMIAPLGSGDLDVGGGAPSAGFYNAVARDVNLKIVADKGTMKENHEYMPLLVRTDLVESGQVNDISDLRGLLIAEPAQSTATASTLSSILGSANMAYGDVQHSFIGFGEHLAAYANGGIDASLTTEPSATTIEEQGLAVRFALPPEYYGDQQLAVILYSGDFVQKSAAATCFMKAYLRGVRDYTDAMEAGRFDSEKAGEVVSIVSAATGISPELYRKVTPNFINPNGVLDAGSLARDYQFFQEQGAIEGTPIELDTIIDSTFAEAAVAELGEFPTE